MGADRQCVARLAKELKALSKEPPTGVLAARPSDEDQLTVRARARACVCVCVWRAACLRVRRQRGASEGGREARARVCVIVRASHARARAYPARLVC